MIVLRRALKIQAALWALGGLAQVIAPRWFLVTVFRQVPYPDYAYPRSMGIACIGLAMLMVLVANRLDEVWWWAWAFAAVNAGLTTLCTLTALFGTPEGSATIYWWLLAGMNAAFGAVLLLGLARAEQTKPIA